MGSGARLVPPLIRPSALAPWAILALALTGCATGSGTVGRAPETPPPAPRQPPPGRDVQVGVASWYGKPHHGIYDYAMSLAGNPPHAAVLAIGDALITDMLDAATQGFGAVFVQGGIHAGEPFPADFASQYGLGDWSPVAVVDSLR